MEFKFDPKELTKEKSLWEIYLASRKIKISKFNKSVLLLSAILVGLYAFFIENDTSLLLSKSRNIVDFGFTFSVSILGFLIAGFTIFATLTKPLMLLKMMDVQHNDSGLPYLKYNFFAFIRVFIFYLGISSFFLIVILFCDKNGMIPKILSSLPEADVSKPYLIRVAYLFLSTSTVFLLLLLKNFIFNIHSIVMNHLRWEHHEWENNNPVHQTPKAKALDKGDAI